MPAHRKLVRGVGVNDAPFHTTVKVKSYQKWLNIFGRCYGSNHPKHELYAGCTVDPQWHSFMTFKEWFDLHDREGWHLDKDLLKPGNRVYGPDHCVMIPAYINDGITRLNAKGWTFSTDCKRKKPYQVVVCGVKMGRYATEDEAHEAWKTGRKAHIQTMINRYLLEDKPDARVVTALKNLIL